MIEWDDGGYWELDDAIHQMGRDKSSTSSEHSGVVKAGAHLKPLFFIVRLLASLTGDSPHQPSSRAPGAVAVPTGIGHPPRMFFDSTDYTDALTIGRLLEMGLPPRHPLPPLRPC
jgi:hypothetical protein